MTETAAALVPPPEAGAPQAALPQEPPPPPAARDEKPPERSATDPEDASIAPDSLRVDQRVGEELFGANYTGNTSYGPAAYGNYNTVTTNNFAPPRPKATFRHLDHVSALMRQYAEADGDNRLDLVLTGNANPVVCLTGPRNSGRFSTACAGLARRYAPDRVCEIVLPAGGTPHWLPDQRKELLAGYGYILRLPDDGHTDVMRALGALFLECPSHLVLIRDEGAQEHELHRAEVQHRQPDPIEVFRKHLAYRLKPADELPAATRDDLVDGYLRLEELRSELNLTYGPREVVAIAELFGQGHPVGTQERDEILSATQPRRRRRASRILLPPEDAGPDRRHRAMQHERAFRIAYAVFRGKPLHYVFESANWLLTEIDGAALRPDWGSMVLRHAVRDLLGPELLGDWLKSRDIGMSASGSSRSAWIHDGGLRGAILDVAWHDFDSTRPALLKWLNRLVQSGDSVMLRAAAETAALLAHHDFDLVHKALIDDWAASPRRLVRQAAAWADTIADMGGQVGHRVRGKVRDWCHGGSNYRRDAAARAYASGLQQQDVNWSMKDLRRIAADGMQRREYAVAEAINQLYEPERAGWLIAELADWTESPDVRIHAARGLLTLARRSERGPADGDPDLLLRLVRGEVPGWRVAQIWRLALVHPSMAESAWSILATWLRRADEVPRFRPAVADLLGLLADGDRLRRRTTFYLSRVWQAPDELPQWVRLVLEERT